MSEIIKIDKRKNSDGYCLAAQSGYVAIIQGSGSQQSVVHLNDSDLQPLLADLESLVTKRSAQHFKKAG